MQQPPSPFAPDPSWNQPPQEARVSNQPSQPGYPPPQYQQPPQGYPQQGSPMPLPAYKPPKKQGSRTWLWIVVCLACLLIGFSIGRAGASPTAPDTAPSVSATQPGSQATTKPSSQPKWTTTHTFTGNGAKKTGTFTAPDDWKILWECSGVPTGLDNAPLFIMVYNSSDNSILDTGVQFSCKAGVKSTGETEEHRAGTVYLDVNSGIDWTITIQELK